MPVLANCGFYAKTGWFVQHYQGRWRWHLGGVSCDGGRPEVEKWAYMVFSFDGRRAAIHQNGSLVASAACSPNLAPWDGPLTVGQYASPNESFQPKCQIGGFRIYRCVLSVEDMKAAVAAGPPGNVK